MTQQYLTVTALTKYLKRKFDADPYLGRVYLTGEISNFRFRANAHQYFSLKDDHAKISAIMFKSAFQKLKFQPKEGMKVMVVGRISLYENSGSYQIYIEHMEPDGVGALYQALAELREKLGKEGLFEGPKQQLPRYPKRIAVVTSPSGAVIRDIITTVKRRYPIAQLVLFPTLVQGEQAADDIVRAIHAATTPIISSVGHETDVTIADMVADVRAATPTAAAELAVPVLNEELLRISERRSRLEQSFLYLLQQRTERFQRLQNSYVFKQPERLYEGQTIKLDRMTQRLFQAMTTIHHQKQRQAQGIIAQLQQQTPKGQLRESQQQLAFLQRNLQTQMTQLFLNKQKQFTSAVQQLDLLSPLKIMGRGYSYTTKEDRVVKTVTELQPADQLTIHYADGTVQANVETITAKKEEF